MSIYIPYFYLIQQVSTGMYYAGSKYGKDSNPQKFMTENGYKTSSVVIRSIIEKEGIGAFVVRKIRTFETGEEAYDYETKFLRKVNAKQNDRFYNQHNNDHLFSYHSERYKEKMIEVYGVEHPLHSNDIRKKLEETCQKKYGSNNVFSKNSSIRKEIDDTIFEKYEVSNISQLQETQQKIRSTSKGKRGVDHHLQDPEIISKRVEKFLSHTEEERQIIDRKIKRTKLEKFGDENFNNREKALTTIKEKYEIDHDITNISQVDHIRKKMSDGMKRTKSDPEWKNSKGKEASKKLSDTLNSEEWKRTAGVEKSRKLSEAAKTREKKQCPHCEKKIAMPNYARWHGDNCKLRD